MTGTRADFGKIKSLLLRLDNDPGFSVHIFVTGMHMLSKYGYTCEEVENCGFKNIHKYVNQNSNDTMDTVLAKTVSGFSDYIKELQPDLIVIHGDRVEALACAAVGSLNNILVAHIEGGELSGTIDELIRHSTSKLSHLHFVSNETSKKRLMQLGENDNHIFVIGSPDIDIMISKNLPSIEKVKKWYDIPFDRYSILLFHAVTTEYDAIEEQAKTLVDTIIESGENIVVIYPNNDLGSKEIIKEYARLENLPQVRLFPSMRFEYFLTLLKNSIQIIGNSSCGVREAPFYGTPTVNVGNRQNNRSSAETIINVDFDKDRLLNAILGQKRMKHSDIYEFGSGGSDTRFHDILNDSHIWSTKSQKQFIDLNQAGYV